MSEFKYACPVCTQHIKCDSSQSGSTMICPTCFQKIIVPQAPDTGDLKFILTGIKVGDRPPVKNPEANPYGSGQTTGLPGAIVVLAIFLMIAIAVGFVYRGTIIKPFLDHKTDSRLSPSAHGTATQPQELPSIASDSNWLMNLANVTIPDTAAAGRIHGQDFINEHASFSNGLLVLRTAKGGPVTSGITVNFAGAQAVALADKKLNILADTNVSARVTLHWLDGTNLQSESFDINYALRLEFGSITNDHLPGKIYLCTPDVQKSYVIGAFRAKLLGPKLP